MSDARLVVEVILHGAKFADGKAKVTVPLKEDVPSGKTVKVYFVDGNSRTDMDATVVDGKVVFETNHFSTYAIVLEDSPNNGSGISPLVFVGIGVAVLVLVGGAAVFFLKRH